MGVRIASGLAALAVVLPLVFLRNPIGIYLLTAVILILGQWEYAGMAFPNERKKLGGLLVVLGALILAGLQTRDFAIAVGATSLALIASSWLVLFSAGDSAAGLHARWSKLFLGLIYVPLPLAFFPLLLLYEDNGLSMLWLVLSATWGGDTGAYFVGKAIGRTPLFPTISPKKTWEGVGGGVLGAVFFCCLFNATLPFVEVPWLDCILLALFFDLAGVTGDLVESMMKRDAGVKDSGVFLPGHGGVLDRIDSALFSLPLAWLYVQWFQG